MTSHPNPIVSLVRSVLPWITAVLLAAFAPALTLAASSADIRMLQMGFIVTLSHAVILGLPVALVYRAKRWTRLSAVLVGAALIGILPFAILSTLGDGATTLPRLLRFLRSEGGLCGALGAIGGLAFWLTLKVFGLLPEANSGRSVPGQ